MTTRFTLRNVAADLDLMAYFYKGSGVSENEDTISSIILGTSMLTGRGVPVAGEYEVERDRHEDHGPLGDRGFFYRVLRSGFRRGPRPHGS